MLLNRVNPCVSYRQVATQTASPGHLVLMLYDGAIRFLERALQGFTKEDPAEANELISNNILRTQDIIHELNVSLNMDAGGEFAANQRGLYLYLERRLMESNLRKEEEGIHEVLRHITILRDAWSAMLNGQETEPGEKSLSLLSY